MTKSTHPKEYHITGLDCAEEVAILKREIGPLVGGTEYLAFDILNAKMILLPDGDELSATELKQAVSKTGMKAEVWQTTPSQKEATSWWELNQRTFLTFCSGCFILLGFLTHAYLAGSLEVALGMAAEHSTTPIISGLLYACAILSGVWFVLPKAWFALKRFRPDMNLLMTLAVMGAIILNEWLEASMVSFLFALSLALESWSVSRARNAVASLLDLAPVAVRKIVEEHTQSNVSPNQMEVGDLFLIKSGERFPLDGIIEKGTGEVNQAPITGESLPIEKQPGDEVYAGTINGDNVVTIRCSKPVHESLLARMIQLVSEAQSRRAPAEQWVEKFAQIYTPTICVLALLMFSIPPLFFFQSWNDWFYRALVLLVIGCPCALVISTPVSIVAGLTSAARNGVLIKGGIHLETPASLKAIAFDKTGTLTKGNPQVIDVIPLNDHSSAELLERAASIEMQSTHPLAQALVDYAQEKRVAVSPAEDYKKLPGRGATGKFRGKDYWLGSHRYLVERNQETEEIREAMQELTESGTTLVFIGNDSHVCGIITLGDTIRENAIRVMRKLSQQHIQVAMLTGDNQATANSIAVQLAIPNIKSELLPEDKVTAIEELVEEFQSVAMVGDGVNDAPAMARSQLGIAMGSIGSDAAIESADIALMSDDLSKIPWLIEHSKRTMTIIRQNIFLSIAIKVLFVLLTLVNLGSLWAAIAADMGTSLLVIFNGLRLLNSTQES